MTKIEYLLACLSEECSEVQHAACKALRFGLHDTGPNNTHTNAQNIVREFSDIMAIIELLADEGAIVMGNSNDEVGEKIARVLELMDRAGVV